MRWVLGSDHAGYNLKIVLLKHLESLGFDTYDVGTNSSEVSCDYPDYADKVCVEILSKRASMGVLVCGSGIGVSMRANRFMGIRAPLIHNTFTAQAAKEHSNANILCFGERTTSAEDAIHYIETFLKHNFEGGRHETRLQKLDSPLPTIQPIGDSK